METRKLYYEDPFQKGFATTVVSCDEVKGGYAVVLAETAFYPEGGGQRARGPREKRCHHAPL